MDYQQKYLKYKNKYQKLLQKKGGALVFNDFNDANKVLLKTKMEGNKLTYNIPSGRSNNFTEEQKKSLEIMTTHILPNIVYKGNKLGYNFVKDVETFGAGTFGVTISYNDLIIKIMIARPGSDSAVNEILILENVYNTPGQEPPENLSKYYGFIAGKDIPRLEPFDVYKNREINIISNLFNKPNFAFNNITEIIANIIQITSDPNAIGYLYNNFFSGMILAFFDKEDGDMDKFIKEICPKLTIEQKVLISKEFFEDISWGLDFLHRTKNQMHCDIKAANIVYKLQPDRTFKFKLIDFGTLTKINPVTGKAQRINGGTPLYYTNTNYMKLTGQNFSYMYDYFCTLVVIMQIWGVVLTGDVVITIANMMDNLYRTFINIQNIDQTIEELIRNMNSFFRIALPPASSNPAIKETYELLIPYFIQGNITGGDPSPLS